MFTSIYFHQALGTSRLLGISTSVYTAVPVSIRSTTAFHVVLPHCGCHTYSCVRRRFINTETRIYAIGIPYISTHKLKKRVHFHPCSTDKGITAETAPTSECRARKRPPGSCSAWWARISSLFYILYFYFHQQFVICHATNICYLEFPLWVNFKCPKYHEKYEAQIWSYFCSRNNFNKFGDLICQITVRRPLATKASLP